MNPERLIYEAVYNGCVRDVGDIAASTIAEDTLVKYRQSRTGGVSVRRFIEQQISKAKKQKKGENATLRFYNALPLRGRRAEINSNGVLRVRA